MNFFKKIFVSLILVSIFTLYVDVSVAQNVNESEINQLFGPYCLWKWSRNSTGDNEIILVEVKGNNGTSLSDVFQVNGSELSGKVAVGVYVGPPLSGSILISSDALGSPHGQRMGGDLGNYITSSIQAGSSREIFLSEGNEVKIGEINSGDILGKTDKKTIYISMWNKKDFDLRANHQNQNSGSTVN